MGKPIKCNSKMLRLCFFDSRKYQNQMTQLMRSPLHILPRFKEKKILLVTHSKKFFPCCSKYVFPCCIFFFMNPMIYFLIEFLPRFWSNNSIRVKKMIALKCSYSSISLFPKNSIIQVWIVLRA